MLSVTIVAFFRSFITERNLYDTIIKHEISTLRTLGKSIARNLPKEYFFNSPLAQEFCTGFSVNKELGVSILSLEGEFIGDSHDLPAHLGSKQDAFEIKDAVNEGFGSAVKFSPRFSKETIFVDIPVYDENNVMIGIFELSKPVEGIRKDLRHIVVRNSVISFLLIFAAAIVGAAIIRGLLRPIKALRDAADRYGDSEFTFDPHVEKPEEMRLLSETMKTMATSLRSRISLIEHQRNELEMILSSMVEAVIVLDANLVIKKINNMGLTLANRKREEVENRSLIEIFRNSELYEFATQILLSSGPKEISISIFSNVPPAALEDGPFSEKGREMYLQVHGSPLQGDENENAKDAVLLVLHDITKLKSLENMRKDFVANVSHELKTPITSIKGFVETLLAGAVKDPSKAVRFLEIIEKHTHRLNSIIDDLLSLSRLEQYENIELEFKCFSLSSLIGRAVSVCSNKAKKNNIPITVQCDETLSAEINPQLIEQALVNLIDNAIKYSESGSAVSISVIEEAKGITISVIDNGCGIPDQALDRIFERFYRIDRARSRDLGGTGLGLAIVKHIALAHNGEAIVRSEIGKGSTFSLILPKEQPRYFEES